MDQTSAQAPLSTNPDAQPFFLRGNEVGVVLLHGFTSTPQSIRYVGHELHRNAGVTVLAPLLAGHGLTPEELGQTGYQDWLDSAEKALEMISNQCSRVVAAGLSLGGTLALNLAARFSKQIDGIITINGSTGLYKPETALMMFDDKLPDFLSGIGSDIRHPERREICYERIPRSALRERFLLTNATGALLPMVRQPILVVQSRVDHVVSTANAVRIVKDVGSDEVHLLWLSESYHVATLDYDRDRIVDAIGEFTRRRCHAILGVNQT